MNLKEKVYGLLKKKNPNKLSEVIFGRIKKKIRSPFIYLIGFIITYYTFKFIYYKEINKSGIESLQMKIDYLTKLSEENNRILKSLK